MIPIKVPNLELSSGKLPAAYRIDPVMLGNPWHGEVTHDATDPFNTVTTLNTEGGPTIDASVFDGSYSPDGSHFVWKPPGAPGAPAWLSTPNPDPSTGRYYTDYLIMWMRYGAPQFMLPYLTSAGTMGAERMPSAWLMRASDGRNWRVRIQSLTWDSAANQVSITLYVEVYGVVEKGTPPAAKTLSAFCPDGQAGQATPLWNEADGYKELAWLAVSRDGRKAALGMSYYSQPASDWRRAAWIALYELEVDVQPDGSATLTLSLLRGRDSCLGTFTSSVNEPPSYRATALDVTTTTEPDGTTIETWGGITVSNGSASNYTWLGFNGSRTEQIDGYLVTAYYDDAGTLVQVNGRTTATASHSFTESNSGATGELSLASDGTVNYDTRTSGTVDWNGTSSGYVEVQITAPGGSISFRIDGQKTHQWSQTYRPEYGVPGYKNDYSESWSEAFDLQDPATNLYSDSYSNTYTDAGGMARNMKIVTEFDTAGDASEPSRNMIARESVFTDPSGAQMQMFPMAIHQDLWAILLARPVGIDPYGALEVSDTDLQVLRGASVSGWIGKLSWTDKIRKFWYYKAFMAEMANALGKNLRVAVHPIDGRRSYSVGSVYTGWL